MVRIHGSRGFWRRPVRPTVLAAIALMLVGAAPELSLGADAAKAPAGKPAARAPEPDQRSERININTATQEQLETLPGVGPSLARRILDYRKENGPFKRPEELLNVKGIGEKSFARFKDRLTVGP